MDYQPPVSQLLTLGEDPARWGGFDYLSIGLGQEHVPELVRLLLDEDLAEGDEPELWAHIHALHALGQLRATEASAAIWQAVLADDERDSDWFQCEAPAVFGQIGPAALPTLFAALDDRSRPEQDVYPPWTAAMGIAQIANRHPESRAECLAALVAQLEKAAANDTTLNAGVIQALMKIKATEAADVIERAFAAKQVDISIFGGWPEVRYAMGLGPKPTEPPPGVWGLDPIVSDQPRKSGPAKDHAKARRKQAKASKKRNRKKKK